MPSSLGEFKRLVQTWAFLFDTNLVTVPTTANMTYSHCSQTWSHNKTSPANQFKIRATQFRTTPSAQLQIMTSEVTVKWCFWTVDFDPFCAALIVAKLAIVSEKCHARLENATFNCFPVHLRRVDSFFVELEPLTYWWACATQKTRDGDSRDS